MKKAKTKPPKAARAPKTAAGVAVPIALQIEQGYGLKASLDDAYLILEQHDGESGNDDKICLSRSEFRALTEKFAPWAGAA